MYNKFGTYTSINRLNAGTFTGYGWDLGLNASSITWLSVDEVEVYYDFTDDDQLLDFTPAGGSGFTRNSGDNTVTITNGSGQIDAVIWNQPMLCYEISSSHAISVSGRSAHINVYCDLLSSWNGTPFNPTPGLGVVGNGSNGFFTLLGGTFATSFSGFPNTDAVSSLVFQSPSDRSISNQTGTLIVSYSNAVGGDRNDTQDGDLINDTLHPDLDGRVAFGAYSTDTIWGNIKFTGKILQV